MNQAGADAQLRVRIVPLPTAELEPVKADWLALEAQAPAASFYLTHDWLDGWSRIYQPRHLSLIRIEEGGLPVALGLLESAPPSRWRFAGGPVTAERGLLCADGAEQRAWGALGEWLRDHPRAWSSIDGAGLPEEAACLPGVRCEWKWVPRLELPGSFDAYLAARTRNVRQVLRRRLREVERAGGSLVEVHPADRAAALSELVILHAQRARSKGQRHPEVDERLARLLDAMAGSVGARPRVFALEMDGRRVAVTARLDRGSVGYFYNAGFDPSYARLSPGIVVEVASIRDAIDRGLRDYDLGPGAFDFKLRLGGVPVRRLWIRGASSSPVGRMAGLAGDVYQGARRRLPLRSLGRRMLVGRRRST